MTSSDEQRRFVAIASEWSDTDILRYCDAMGWTADPLIAFLASRIETAPDRYFDRFHELEDHTNELKDELQELRGRNRRLVEQIDESHKQQISMDLRDKARGERGPSPVFMPFIMAFIHQHGPRTKKQLLSAGARQWPEHRKQLSNALNRAIRDGRLKELGDGRIKST